jgi:hypothetical protein
VSILVEIHDENFERTLAPVVGKFYESLGKILLNRDIFIPNGNIFDDDSESCAARLVSMQNLRRFRWVGIVMNLAARHQ